MTNAAKLQEISMATLVGCYPAGHRYILEYTADAVRVWCAGISTTVARMPVKPKERPPMTPEEIAYIVAGSEDRYGPVDPIKYAEVLAYHQSKAAPTEAKRIPPPPHCHRTTTRRKLHA